MAVDEIKLDFIKVIWPFLGKGQEKNEYVLKHILDQAKVILSESRQFANKKIAITCEGVSEEYQIAALSEFIRGNFPRKNLGQIKFQGFEHKKRNGLVK